MNRGRSSRWRAIGSGALRVALGVLLFVALVQSGTVALAWWRGELAEMGAREWFWLLLLPVLVALYLRYFSILRADCDACLPDDARRGGGPHGP